MERISLREAAERISRSVTTLRRYIRSGRLEADKLPGRFGPEYVVTTEQLHAAGLDAPAAGSVAIAAARADSTGSVLAARSSATIPVAAAPWERVLRESVPMTLFQDLQLKHEQLLVQYGMIRAGGLRVLDMQAELDTRRRQIEDAQAENTRVKERLAREAGELRKRLREAELELEGRRIESAALREKVRGLEMLTRNTVTNEAIDQQFSHVMDQMRRVDRLTAEQDVKDPAPAAPWPARGPHPDPEH
jgi:predicted nuclease with TOPRIM domain